MLPRPPMITIMNTNAKTSSPICGSHHDQRRISPPASRTIAPAMVKAMVNSRDTLMPNAFDVLDVLNAGADRLADDGAIEERPDADIDQQGDGDDHQAINRNLGAKHVDLQSATSATRSLVTNTEGPP